MNNAEKLLWMYMVQHGHIGAKWSFYGGCYDNPVGADNTNLLANIKRYGVDWDKTQSVRDRYESEFTDTFHDPNNVQVLEGTIYLNNGKHYDIGSTDALPDIMNAMNSYIPDCFEELENE